MNKVLVTADATVFEKKLSQLQFTRNQTYGFFFYLGAISAVSKSPEENQHNLKRLAKWNEITLLDEIVGDYYSGRIEKVLDEFIFRSGQNVSCRSIEIEHLEPRTLFNPVDRGDLVTAPTIIKTRADTEKLYMSLIEFLGSELQHDELNISKAVLCGVFQFQVLYTIDNNAIIQLIDLLKRFSPPSFVSLGQMALSNNISEIEEYLDIQIVLTGMWNGLSPNFMKTAWPFQSYLYFMDGIPKQVEFSSYERFFDYCCRHAQLFMEINGEHIPKLSETNVSLDGLIKWPEISGQYEFIKDYIESVWGFSENALETKMQGLHYKSCIIHCVFCSLAISKETMN